MSRSIRCEPCGRLVCFIDQERSTSVTLPESDFCRYCTRPVSARADQLGAMTTTAIRTNYSQSCELRRQAR